MMPIRGSLNTYLQGIQQFMRDQRQDLMNPGDLIEYVNRARREIAMRSQSIRRLTPISAPIVSASIVAAGSGYTTTPTITIIAPDFPGGAGANPGGAQATATADVNAGSLTAIDITYGGDGYFQPTASITDSTGTGASISLQVGPINLLNQDQEVYKFSDIDLSMFPGVDSVFAIKGVTVLYANYRYSLGNYSFSDYQAYIRKFPFQYKWTPTVYAQYGQGADGSLYCFPIPSQTFQAEFDCFCLPSDLETDQDYEALPEPWCGAVSYYATHLAFLELQNFNASNYYDQKYREKVSSYSQYTRPGRASNMYGRF
jgi:hypothetical protein